MTLERLRLLVANFVADRLIDLAELVGPWLFRWFMGADR